MLAPARTWNAPEKRCSWILGLPFPIVLAVIAGLLDLIPQIGATIAGVILVLVGLTVSTPVAIAMAVIQIIYQQVENYIIYPIVYRQAVSLTPLTTIRDGSMPPAIIASRVAMRSSSENSGPSPVVPNTVMPSHPLLISQFA